MYKFNEHLQDRAKELSSLLLHNAKYIFIKSDTPSDNELYYGHLLTEAQVTIELLRFECNRMWTEICELTEGDKNEDN